MNTDYTWQNRDVIGRGISGGILREGGIPRPLLKASTQ